MFKQKYFLLFISVPLSMLLISCSGDFDKDTGMYINTGKGFSINFPTGWGITKAQAGALVTVTDPNETAQMNIIIQEVKDDVSLGNYYKTVSSRGSRVGSRIKDSGAMKLDGFNARWSRTEITVGGMIFSSLNYYVKKGEMIYSIVCTTANEDLPGFKNELVNAVESFMFIE